MLKLSRLFRVLRLGGFLRSSAGAAAVEFAIVFPVALLLYVGAAELSDAVTVSRKVETISRTVVDLLSQQAASSQSTSYPTPATATTATTLQTLMTASTGLLYPASTAPLQMTLSAIDINSVAGTGICCTITVRWSFTQNGTLRPCVTLLSTAAANAAPSPTTIPAILLPVAIGAILPAPIYLLVADVSYTYQPLLSSSYISFASGMSRTSYIFPRALGQIIAAPPLPTSGSQTGKVCY